MAENQNTNEPTPDAEASDGMDSALAEAQSAIDEMRAEADAAGAAPEKAPAADGASGLDLLGDVDLQVSIELGRTEMLVEDVLKLGEGSVVELDKLAGDPVDVYVNGRLIARGEVLVLNDNFCIRISEIVANLEEQATAAAESAVS